MVPGFDSILSGGAGSSITVPISAEARTGEITFGAFTFSPKASELPPLAWGVIGIVAFGAIALMLRRRR